MKSYSESSCAEVAKIIEKQLSSMKIPCRVISKSLSKGDMVKIELKNQNPKTMKDIRNFVRMFSRSVDEVNNHDLPKVDFVLVNNSYEGEMAQMLWDYVRKKYKINASSNPEYAKRYYVPGMQSYGDELMDFYFYGMSYEFWEKHLDN